LLPYPGGAEATAASMAAGSVVEARQRQELGFGARRAKPGP
jgi:hypothetical protein